MGPHPALSRFAGCHEPSEHPGLQVLKAEEAGVGPGVLIRPPPCPLDIIHKFIRDKYSKRFPELESLVPNALDYIRTVKVSGGKCGLRRN